MRRRICPLPEIMINTVLLILGLVIAIPIGLVILSLIVLAPAKGKLISDYSEGGGFSLLVRFLFFSIHIFPLKKKNTRDDSKKKPETKAKSLHQKKPDKPDKKKKDGLIVRKIKSLTIEDYVRLISIVGDLFRNGVFADKLHIYVVVSLEDAADTAVAYGMLNSAVFPIAGRFHSAGKLKDGEIHISPDFSSGHSSADVSVVFSMRVWRMYVTAAKLFVYIMKVKDRSNKNERRK